LRGLKRRPSGYNFPDGQQKKDFAMKNSPNKYQLAFALSLLLLTALACGGPATSAPTALPTNSPTQPPPPTHTPPPLYLSIVFGSNTVSDSSPDPLYTIEANLPVLQGSDDPRVAQFNNEMTQLTQEEIAGFKDITRNAFPTPGSNGSSFTQTYEVLSPTPGNFISVKFTIDIYLEGAAHPGKHTRVLTYDLEAGSNVSMDQLFLTGSDYLKPISVYCINELKSRDIGFEDFTTGAVPTPENYSNWNFTPDGLMITFDEYQVGPYAVGAQTVTVPYTELQAVIDPNGPLGQFIQ
jgi:hypothetical protein